MHEFSNTFHYAIMSFHYAHFFLIKFNHKIYGQRIIF